LDARLRGSELPELVWPKERQLARHRAEIPIPAVVASPIGKQVLLSALGAKDVRALSPPRQSPQSAPCQWAVTSGAS
jgi:hypothetical protein